MDFYDYDIQAWVEFTGGKWRVSECGHGALGMQNGYGYGCFSCHHKREERTVSAYTADDRFLGDIVDYNGRDGLVCVRNAGASAQSVFDWIDEERISRIRSFELIA